MASLHKLATHSSGTKIAAGIGLSFSRKDFRQAHLSCLAILLQADSARISGRRMATSAALARLCRERFEVGK